MKTTLELTIVRLRLVQSDEDFTADEHPTLSGMRTAERGGDKPGLAKCQPREFPWRKASKR